MSDKFVKIVKKHKTAEELDGIGDLGEREIVFLGCITFVTYASGTLTIQKIIFQ